MNVALSHRSIIVALLATTAAFSAMMLAAPRADAQLISAPEVTATDPPSPAGDLSPRVMGTATDGTTVRIYRNASCSGPAAAQGTPATFNSTGIPTPVPSGSTTTFAARSAAVFLGVTVESACSTSNVTYVHQAALPSTTITAGPSGTINDVRPQFSFESDAGGATFDCSLVPAGQPDSFAPCSSPFSPAADLDDGSYTFRVRATSGGNTGAAATRNFTVDTVPPTATVTGGPEGTTGDRRPAFTFTADETPSTFQCSIVPAMSAPEFSPCTSPYRPDENLSSGDHVFSVRATDAAGNTGPVATREFTVDLSVPAAPVLSGTVPGSPARSTSPRVVGSAGDGVSVAIYTNGNCSGQFAAVGTSAELADPGIAVDVPANATTQLSARAAIVVGGETRSSACSSPALTYVSDTIAPTVRLTGAPDETTSAARPTFRFRASESPVQFQCSITAPGSPAQFAVCTSPFRPTPLDDGDYLFRVRAIDPAGNVSEAVRHTFRVQTSAPVRPRTARPRIRSSQPRSPATVRRPAIIGRAPGGTRVQIFRGSCGSNRLAVGSAKRFRSNGLRLNVRQGQRTRLRARANRKGERPSRCSKPFTYRHLQRTRPVAGRTCSARIQGTNQRDFLRGTNGSELIIGRRGNDRIFGRGGDDCINAGPGNNRINTGRGSNVVRTGRGNSRIVARGGSNVILARKPGRNRIIANDGRTDLIVCGPRNDRVVADRVDIVAPSCNNVVYRAPGR